jgi:hypothetical protein
VFYPSLEAEVAECFGDMVRNEAIFSDLFDQSMRGKVVGQSASTSGISAHVHDEELFTY